MSTKRQAPNELNHENWDQEDPVEEDQTGGFAIASKEVLEKRVIRTAKRRSHAISGEAKKSVFSGFSGFNKTQPSSFDFLSNLTNGNKNNGALPSTSETAVSSSSLNSKPSNTTSSGIFSLSGTSTPTKTAFGKMSDSPFGTGTGTAGTITTSSIFGQSVFTTSKADSTVNDNPFKMQSTITSPIVGDSAKQTNPDADKPISQVSSTIFGTPSTNANSSNSLFSSTSSNFAAFKKQSTPTFNQSTPTLNQSTPTFNQSTPTFNQSTTTLNPSTTPTLNPSTTPTLNQATTPTLNQAMTPTLNQSTTSTLNQSTPSLNQSTTPILNQATTPTLNQSNEVKKPENKSEDKSSQLAYYSKLKGLNESVSDWIKKHVEETPLCILTPIFRDYEKHLKVIQDDYEKSKEQSKKDSSLETKKNASADKSPPASANSFTSTIFSGNKTSSIFAPVTSPPKSLNTSFGINTSTSVSTSTFSTATIPSTGFSFGIKPSSNSSPFTTATTSPNGNTPFSFGIGKPFSFSTNVNTPKSEESKADSNENEDVPPKVEYTPIVEENSVYDKKCKIFVKKDGNFVDKGVGTLYIKKIEESGKHQLLVRANTTLGNVLLNLILGSAIPTQRMGKNNVMLVCIPTPDAKPPPTSVLIRVKTTEEADELLETLNKYKA